MRSGELLGPRGEAWRVDVPATKRERTRGLRGRSPLGPERAMFFPRCRSVHTVGMRAAITVVSLDGEMNVLGVRRMEPRRLLLPRPSVRHILELDAGVRLRLGDRLIWASRPPPEMLSRRRR